MLTYCTSVEVSLNRKLGNASATYASQASCPTSCRFYGNGCYAEHGFTGVTTRRLAKAGPAPALKIAREEARAIAQLSGRRPLRLHVVGDCKTPAAARTVAAAAHDYRVRGGGMTWTYTHAWRTVPRAAWGTVSVLASCETVADVAAARRRGYATSMVVTEFTSKRLYTIGDGVRLLPCAEQTSGVSCTDCRLCFDDARLRDRDITIGFAVHSAGDSKARRALPVIQ